MSGYVWLWLTFGYICGSVATWITGAAHIGTHLEEIEANGDSVDVTSPLFRAAVWACLTGLIWPVAVPVYLAFNKGKTIGLNHKQTKRLLDKANAEIERIKKAEGWA